MKPVKNKFTTFILKAPKGKENEVFDLPIARFKDSNNLDLVESCWELSEKEIQTIIKTKKIFFACWGVTHPPILLQTKSLGNEGNIDE
jgi:hypothetical protein